MLELGLHVGRHGAVAAGPGALNLQVLQHAEAQKHSRSVGPPLQRRTAANTRCKSAEDLPSRHAWHDLAWHPGMSS